MKTKIDVILNEKGRKLTTKKTHVIIISKDYIPGEEELEELVYNEVPKELVDKYEITQEKFVDLIVGDIIKVVYPNGNGILTKVSKINSKSIIVEGYYTSFKYDGTERGGKRKSELKLEFPTQKDLDDYAEREKRTFLINKIKKIVDDWDDLGYYKTEVLEDIYNLLRNEKSKIFS